MTSDNNELIQANLLEQSTYQNGYSAYISSAQSIGFKVNSMRYQEHVISHLAYDFLANLGFTRNNIESECSIRAFLEPSGIIMLSYANQEDNNHLPKVRLPNSAPLKLSLEQVLKTRRSVRHYTGDKVSLTYLATVLRAACGITATNEVDIGMSTCVSMSLRTSASAGGIYPVDLYVIANNVEKLAQSVYQYNPTEDCLVRLHDKQTADKLIASFSIPEEQISIKRAGFIILFTGSAAKAMHKYGNQGLSFTLQEVGSISQNIRLAVTALGLASVDCASYYLNEMHEILKLDGIYKHLFHSIVVGTSQ